MNTSTARRLLPTSVGLVAATAALVPMYLFGDDLPVRIATHYDGSGAPNQSMTPGQFLLTNAIFMAIGVLVLAGLTVASKRLVPYLVVTLGFVGGFVAGMGAGIASSEVIAQRGNATWQDATSPLWGVAWSVLLAVALGAYAARLAARLPADRRLTDTAANAPVLPLARGQHAVWTGVISSHLMVLLGLGFLLTGAYLAALAARPFGWALVVAALPILALSHVELLAGKDGLTLRYGPIGFPRQHLEIERIETASAIEVRPTQWGGWGYRGSLLLMKQAALVLHGGPGLRLDLSGGKTFVVAVDHPEVAAAVLNGERARSRAAQ